MNERRLYIDESVMLATVALPLAVAEGQWILLILSVAAAFAGWQITIRKGASLLSPWRQRVFVVAAFVFLLAEYLYAAVAVLALCHFMQLVCISKLLQERTMRDHAQMLVLLLMLLSVTAIVSGNLLFPIAMAVFLTLGLDALMRFHLGLEAARVEQRSHASVMVGGSKPEPGEMHPGRYTVGLVAGWGLLVGAAVFVLCPRLDSPLLVRFTSAGGPSITGFSPSPSFRSLGPIHESERLVMTVVLKVGDTPITEMARGPYFRGSVSSRYVQTGTGPRGRWEWRRFGPGRGSEVTLNAGHVRHSGPIPVLRGYPEGAQRIEQEYKLEAMPPNLFTLYPAVNLTTEMTGDEDLRKYVEDQSLHLHRSLKKSLRYSVSSLRFPADGAASLAAERAALNAQQPEVYPPEGLPRQREYLAMVEALRRGMGSLDGPENRLKFARRVEERLRSREFSYTLNPPPASGEPIGEFLFRHRRGHCVYFASSMALLCQLAGVPARVVSGYCGGEYNPLGQGFIMVRQKHAHSWVEVFVPGKDWVTFDPTPAEGGQAARTRRTWLGVQKYVDYVQFQWANMVVSYDAGQRRTLFERFTAWLLRPVQTEDTVMGAVAAFVRELFGWRLTLTWKERLIYWVFALLVVALMVLLSYVVVVTAKRMIRLIGQLRRKGRFGRPEAEFYQRFIRRLSNVGISRRKDQTPAEFAAEVARQWPVCAESVALVEAYYHVVFGKQALTESRRQQIESFLRRLALANPPTQGR